MSRAAQHGPPVFRSTPEYDAFGPWVLPVTGPDEVPPLFRRHPIDFTGTQLVLKVPRPIERRDALPSMDLYDHLLILQASGLTVLTRVEDQVRTHVVAPSELLAIEDATDLLDGRLTLFTALPEGPVTVHYNGSSRDVVGQLVDGLRAFWGGGPRARSAEAAGVAGEAAEAAGVEPPTQLGLTALGPDVALVTAYRELARTEPWIRLLSAQARQQVVPAGQGAGAALARALHTLWPMTVQGAIVTGDGRELQVVHRREWWLRGRRPVHSLARTVIPLARVVGIEAEDDPRYAGVRVLTVVMGPARISFPVAAASATEDGVRAGHRAASGAAG